MAKRIIVLAFLPLLLTVEKGSAQQAQSSQVASVLTADSLASGNLKNVLTSFFQLSLNNLTGPNKSLNFAANPYAIMLRSDSTLAVDSNFRKYKTWRKLNFNFSLSLDSSYHFNGFSSGVKYALINQRDSTESSWLLAQTQTADAEFNQLFNALLAYDVIYTMPPKQAIDSLLGSKGIPFDRFNASLQDSVRQIAKRNKLSRIANFVKYLPDSVLALQKDTVGQEWTVLSNSLHGYSAAQLQQWGDSVGAQSDTFSDLVNAFYYGKNKAFHTLDTNFQHLVLSLAKANHLDQISIVLKNPSDTFALELYKPFDSLKRAMQNRLLWTIGLADTTYADQFLFSNIVLSTELLKSVLNPNSKTNLELDIKASQNFVDDSAIVGRNLKRSFFSFEPGLNWVIKNKAQKSFVELQFSGQYEHFFSGWYGYEQQNQLLFNGTLRIRIINDIWIPLQFSYNPKSGNVLGFLNVTTNFTALGNLLKSNKN